VPRRPLGDLHLRASAGSDDHLPGPGPARKAHAADCHLRAGRQPPVRRRGARDLDRFHPPVYVSELLTPRAHAEAHQRWNAGWPSFTATKVPLQVAQTLPFASKEASMTARSSDSSVARARSSSSASLGVARLTT